MSNEIVPGTRLRPATLAALREGRNRVLVRELATDLRIDFDELPAAAIALATRAADLAIDLRRENVAVLGSHEAFVRRSPAGLLQQVIRPVRLSIAEGHLYQIPRRRKVKAGTTEVAHSSYQGATEWVDLAKYEARCTYDGLVAQNAVAGCAVLQPPSINVDGRVCTNPAVFRTELPGGRIGDIQRIVVGVVVVGPSPTTGNPVMVSYTLDYDPAKDLHHMLASVANDEPNECYLLDEEEYLEQRAAGATKPGWKYTPIYGGVGYHYNLRNSEIRKAYAEFVGIAANATRKAQTVARRNAMRSHPAFRSQVSVDDQGVAIIPAIGWAGDDGTMRRWSALQERLARGLTLPDDVDKIDVAAVYDPEQHDDEAARRTVDAEAEVVDPDQAARHALIEQIDRGINLAPLAVVANLNYDPTAGLDELRSVLARLSAALDAEVSS